MFGRVGERWAERRGRAVPAASQAATNPAGTGAVGASDGAGGTGAAGVVPAPAEPRGEWRQLAVQRRTFAPAPLLTAPADFAAGLSTWQNPSLGGALGHAVSASAPGGLLPDIARLAPPEPSPVGDGGASEDAAAAPVVNFTAPPGTSRGGADATVSMDTAPRPSTVDLPLTVARAVDLDLPVRPLVALPDPAVPPTAPEGAAPTLQRAQEAPLVGQLPDPSVLQRATDVPLVAGGTDGAGTEADAGSGQGAGAAPGAPSVAGFAPAASAESGDSAGGAVHMAGTEAAGAGTAEVGREPADTDAGGGAAPGLGAAPDLGDDAGFVPALGAESLAGPAQGAAPEAGPVADVQRSVGAGDGAVAAPGSGAGGAPEVRRPAGAGGGAVPEVGAEAGFAPTLGAESLAGAGPAPVPDPAPEPALPPVRPLGLGAPLASVPVAVQRVPSPGAVPRPGRVGEPLREVPGQGPDAADVQRRVGEDVTGEVPAAVAPLLGDAAPLGTAAQWATPSAPTAPGAEAAGLPPVQREVAGGAPGPGGASAAGQGLASGAGTAGPPVRPGAAGDAGVSAAGQGPSDAPGPAGQWLDEPGAASADAQRLDVAGTAPGAATAPLLGDAAPLVRGGPADNDGSGLAAPSAAGDNAASPGEAAAHMVQGSALPEAPPAPPRPADAAGLALPLAPGGPVVQRFDITPGPVPVRRQTPVPVRPFTGGESASLVDAGAEHAAVQRLVAPERDVPLVGERGLELRGAPTPTEQQPPAAPEEPVPVVWEPGPQAQRTVQPAAVPTARTGDVPPPPQPPTPQGPRPPSGAGAAPTAQRATLPQPAADPPVFPSASAPPVHIPSLAAGDIAVAAGIATRAPDGSVVFAAPEAAPAPVTPAPVAVQRAETPAPEAAPAPATPAPPAPRPGPGTPAPAPTAESTDELVRRLLGPLTRLLRAELRLDRERAGYRLDSRH